MKKIVVILLAVLLLASCKTVEMADDVQMLPSYNPVLPDRPVLSEVPDDAQIPKEVNLNMVKLISYIEQLEAYAEGWVDYYNMLLESGKVGIVIQ